jgi:hypothetical protein
MSTLRPDGSKMSTLSLCHSEFMEVFAVITVVMLLLYLVTIKFPIPCTPLEVLWLAPRLLSLQTGLRVVCGVFLSKDLLFYTSFVLK